MEWGASRKVVVREMGRRWKGDARACCFPHFTPGFENFVPFVMCEIANSPARMSARARDRWKRVHRDKKCVFIPENHTLCQKNA